MGNSAVYRILTTDDVDSAYAMAQRLLGLTSVGCRCPQDVDAGAEVSTHGRLDRYLSIGTARLYTRVPADLLDQVRQVVEPCLGGDGDGFGSPGRDGSVYLHTDLSPAMVAALQGLPPMTADISTPEYPLPNDLAYRMLAAVGADPASISWQICWPGEHNRTGFELGLNGCQKWHKHPPPGHSVYVHVPPHMPELAHGLAVAVGGVVVGEPAVGW